MKRNFTLSVLLAGLSTFCFAQTPSQRTCGTMEHLHEQLRKDPKLAERMLEMDAANQVAGASKSGSAVITIPVVFHVLYSNSTENISTTRLMEQLTVLNEDFRKTNADAANIPTVWQSIAADSEIQFCLATQDPNGAFTSGINRVATTVASFGTDDKMKFTSSGGADAWDRNKYLNIWVCDLGSQLLGYAQFPGQTASTDGVVLHYRYTGKTGASAPFNKGRTGTHEVGHWLGLYHIWGDDNGACTGSDQVTDTPNQADATYGCFTAGTVKTDACATAAPGYMWQNYMDYTDDACMYMFTAGQKTRMQNVLAGSRASLATSPGCSPAISDDAGITAVTSPSGVYCTGSFAPVVTLQNGGTNTLTSATIAYSVDASTALTYNWTGSLAPGATVSVTLPTMTSTGGTHSFSACASLPNGIADTNSPNDCSVSSFSVQASAGVSLPLFEGFEGAVVPPANWTLNNADGAVTWALANTGATGTRSAFIDNYSYNAAGQVDQLITPVLDFTTVSNPALTFKVAYVMYDLTYVDTLTVRVSADCGSTWTEVYRQYGTALTTVTPNVQSAEFTPAAAGDWRTETISLTSFGSSSSVMVNFRHATGYGNNLFIDDINIDASTGVQESMFGKMVNIFPNPSKDVFNVSVNTTEKVNIKVLDVMGRELSSVTPVFTNGYHALNMQNEAKGVYFVKVTTATETVTKRVVLNK